jgi:hypothetical protein
MSKKLAVALTLLVAIGVMKPALAVNQSISMKTTITGAQLLSACSSPGATSERWQVSMNVAVASGSEQTVTFQDTEFWAKYNSTSAGSNLIQNDITVVDSGGFVAGTQIAPKETKDFTPVVQVSLPCDTQGADMFAGLHLVGNTKQYSDGNTFIGGVTPVPAGPVGAFAVAALIAVAAIVAQRRRRRPLMTSSSGRNT